MDYMPNAIIRMIQFGLKGLRIAPYYGCMLARPPYMNKGKNHYGLIEKTKADLGAECIVTACAMCHLNLIDPSSMFTAFYFTTLSDSPAAGPSIKG